MRGTLLALSLAALAVAACDQQDTSAIDEKIQQLDNQVQAQEGKIRKMVTAVASSRASVFDSPLRQFFAAPEFWEVVYEDTGACHNKCYNAFQSATESCDKLSTEDDIKACEIKAATETANCHQACGQQGDTVRNAWPMSQDLIQLRGPARKCGPARPACAQP